MNPQGSVERKLENDPHISPVCPFDGEELRGHPWPVDTIGVPVGSHATPSQNKRLRKRERPRTRCQGPAQRQNTNNHDDNDELYSDMVILLLLLCKCSTD